jgi:hypothetical protein
LHLRRRATPEQQRKKGHLYEPAGASRFGDFETGLMNRSCAASRTTPNVEAYPNSFNTWSSLGEAYMIRVDKSLAIENFNKSLELNPKNADAHIQLAKLRAQ